MDPFDLQYLPFHLINYALAALFYTLFARVVLGVFTAAQPNNFIMRAFCRVTDPVLRVFSPLTPGFIHLVFVPLYVAFWILLLRFGFGLLMLNLGWAPSVS